jgi:pyruvate,orthophosphate dikinase
MAGTWYASVLGRLRGGSLRAPAPPAPDLPVFDLDHARGEHPRQLTALLGGKGAGLAEMRQILRLPVPPGFVLGTPLCRQYLEEGWPAGLDAAIERRLRALEQTTGRRLDDRRRPLLLAVRSGAGVSMPGMMDSVLNLGVNAGTVEGLAAMSGDERFALDTWVRFCRSYAVTVLGLDADALGLVPPGAAAPAALRAVVDRIRQTCAARGTPIPDDPRLQLRRAVEAVFRSWLSPRAHLYREREGIAHDLGTAVVVQAMVFGNSGGSSGAGIAFSRDPSTGAATPCGDFLRDAQGEDVVAGTRRTATLAEMAQCLPMAHRDLLLALRRIERHYRDLADVEFTVENGTLYLLQTRPGKRSALAALRIAVALVDDPAIKLSRAEAIARVGPDQLRRLRSRGAVRPGALPSARGVGASPGVAAGIACTDPDRVAAVAAGGAAVILVRPTTAPADVHGMAAASGILTASGGAMSHAALVARSWGIPAVCGVSDLVFADGVTLAGEPLGEGELITLDGDEGAVYRGDQHEPQGGEPPEMAILRAWAAALGVERDESAGDTPRGDGGPAADRVALLRALELRGVASIEQLAGVLLTGIDAVRSVLAEASDLVETTPRGLQLTPTGRRWVAARLAEERRQLDLPALDAVYRAFAPLDRALKQIVTDWQMRSIAGGKPVANDHRDAAYDAAVLARLAALDQARSPVLARAVVVLPRLAHYAARLTRAGQAITAGDVAMIASPWRDSYHSVWFELHEELMGLVGRERRTEESIPE